LNEHGPMHDNESSSRGKLGNIVLTGVSASGKSTVGRQLAKLLGLGFVDLDELIEKSVGKKIGDIFSQEGEDAFRERERLMLLALQGLRSHVVAVGGGTLTSVESIRSARRIGPIVWVQSSSAEIARRLVRRISEIEKRPLFSDLVLEESHEVRNDLIQARVQKMMDERRRWFEQADVAVDGSYVTPEMAAQHLKDILVTEGLIEKSQRRFSSWRDAGKV
jgi:shikimate kinase